MAVIRCPRGHYYDEQRFSRCPHCGVSTGGGEAGAGTAGTPKAESEKKRGLLGWLDREKTVALSREKAAALEQAQRAGAHGKSKEAGTAAAPGKNGAAQGQKGGGAGSGASQGQKASVAGSFAGAGADDEKTVALASTEGGIGSGTLDSNTVALEALVGEDDDQRTIGFFSGAKGNDYVTGWLVCLEGPEKGRDYRLHHGFNRIGRSFEMDVQVIDDPAVTREGHCAVVYDDRQNQFSVVPTSGALTYYNGQLLTGPERLKSGDEIGLGNSRFEFVPFCREGRVWEKEDGV